MSYTAISMFYIDVHVQLLIEHLLFSEWTGEGQYSSSEYFYIYQYKPKINVLSWKSW